ncbi:uncharacterized protein LOC134251619 isoform X2 [Saccostrea cucullata]|uniref:uncharacterized protein LOC134251619 isoform X2 n=1 Tax=Saccostrea cuccullata TaxID=36930 RepID=UPI002ED2D9A9
MRLPILLALLGLFVHNAYLQSLNCYVPADIMILLDGSDSIQDRDWIKMKEFVKLLIDNFDIARDAIHLGMVVYSSRIGDHIGLNSFKDKNMLKLLAGALNHPKASTNTAKGIEYVREKFKMDGREGVPKIAIVITDGSSDNPRATKLQANAAKNEGIKVLAVGVGGHMFKDELRNIASRPSKMFTSPTFGTLITLVTEIRNMVCQVITTTTTTTTTPKIPTMAPIYVPPPKDLICNVPGDIVFLMDGSDSISDADFMRQKAFVANMVDNFEISPEAIHVGMVVFSTMIGDVVGLQPAKGKSLLKILAKSLKHPKIGTNTAKGIQRVRKMMAEEGRQFAPKLAVVITDGRSTRPQETIREANLAKAEGITMIAIGVGTEIFQGELRQLASSPQQMFEVRDFSRLGQIINTMRDLICQEIKTTTTTTTTTEMPTPPPSTVPPPEGLICNVPADIGILLDGSDSIDDRGWTKEKNFAANLINNLDIGPDTIHASVVVYSTLIGQTIPFIPFKPKTLLTILARNLKQPKVGTNTARGIQKMREYFRTQGRPNAPKVMVIVTDGRSTRPSATIMEAEQAKREGIIVIAVGVGTQIFRDELRQIATNERKLFEVSDFAALQQIIIAIRDLICQVITTTPPMPTTTPQPVTTTLEPIPGCDVPAEIMFMLQGSQGLNGQSWAESKDFLSTMVNNMYVSPSAHHYGMIVYGSGIGDHVGLQPYKDKFSLQNYFNSLMKPATPGSNVAEALKKMREMFREQGRPSAPKIGVMITNEPTSSPRLSMAETDLAKTEGVKLFTVGVGNLVDRNELLNTATSERHVLLTPNTMSLNSILPNLRHLICEEIQRPVTPRPPHPSHNFTSLCAGCLYDKGTGYNFFPGDCSKFVQCWEDNGYVHGVVKDCPFGEFWEQNELKCKPSIHVHCNMDSCLQAPNGFTYGMDSSGCRAYWVCVNSHSIGSCCAPGTHYVEGMGCMRGLACNEPCPPGGGKIFTPCKKQPHWDRRFYMDDVPQQKIVRHCAPGTIFSKEYCTCIPDMEGLIPVLPGDQCKASAYLPFDVDLKDKSGSNTAIMAREVTVTPYGSAHFTGNSALTMYKYADATLGDKLLISFKFKFDRWPDSLDHAGRVVHLEKGETHWRFDIQSKTWTRNITIGGGWDAQRLMRMFRKLMGSTTAQQMNLHMIEIANSPDFKALLHHLGFMPDATNALQILRILFSGQASGLINQILQKIGHVHGSTEIRRLLYNLLRIEGMNKWIRDHTGNNHKHVLINWQRFLNSLNLNDKDWNKGKIYGFNVNHNMGKLIADLWRIFVNERGMNTRDWRDLLKITFAPDKHSHLGIEFMNEIEGVLGRNRTIKDLWFDFLKGRGVSVSIFGNYSGSGEGHKNNQKHQHFLRYIEDLVKSGKGGKMLNYILGGGKVQTDHGGFTHDGLGHIADIWREYVTDTRLDQDSSMYPYLTWTRTGGGTGGRRTDIFIDELRNVLGNDTIRTHFLDFMKKYDINIVGTSKGWRLERGGPTNDAGAWLYWLFTQTGGTKGGSGINTSTLWPWLSGVEGLEGLDLSLVYEWIFGPGGWNNGGRIGITTNGIITLAELWKLYMAENPLDRNKWGNKLIWTLRSGNNGYRDNYLLLREMRHILSNQGMLRGWQEFLKTHNYNIVLNNNGWDIIKGGSRNDLAAFITWLFVVVDEMESSDVGTDFDWIFGNDWKTGITSTGIQNLAQLWTTFMRETNIDKNTWGNVLFWTLRTNTGKPGLQDYILLLREMRHILADDFLRQQWLEFLSRHNHNIVLTHNGWDIVKGGSQNNIAEFIFWLFATVDEIESSAPGTDFSWIISITGSNNLRISITQNGLQSLMNLWDMFIAESNLDRNSWGNVLFWTLRAPTDTVQNKHYILLLKEMRHVLADNTMRGRWLQFLSKHNYNIVLVTEGWDIVKGGSINDASAFIFWLFNIVDSIENSSITDIDWIFIQGKQSWDRFHGRGFKISGLQKLVVLWEQFVSHMHIDTSLFNNAMQWTNRKKTTGEVTHQDYLLFFREMRHLLDNEMIRNQFIDFMTNSGYNIVLTTVGWDLELGGTRNDIAGFIYWLVTTVDLIESSVPGTIIDWLFITDVTSYIGGSGTSSMQDSLDYYGGGYGMGDMLGLLAAEDLMRKKRSTDNVRQKRQAHSSFHYQSLVGNCYGNNPSIDIAANEQNVKMTLVTMGSSQPGELILPIVKGWNEVTLVYNGRDMHAMVNNWQGEKKQSIPMRGNIQSRPEGISLGSCPKYDGLKGKIDDFVFYECIPLAIQNKIGRS